MPRLMTKRSNKRRRTYNINGYSSSVAPIKSLPKELLVEVIARVVSGPVVEVHHTDLCSDIWEPSSPRSIIVHDQRCHKRVSDSVVDLHSIKRCCKDFLDASEDNYVWQQVCLDKFPLYQWFRNDKVTSFLERCMRSGNIDSLFREGLRKYFKHPNSIIDGLEDIKMAAQKGLMQAQYVYSMILLCSHGDDNFRKQGLEYMRSIRKSKCIMKCRRMADELLSGLWKNGIIVRNHTALCRSKNTCKGCRFKKKVWDINEDDDDIDGDSCEDCRWDYEVEFFYRIFYV